MATYSVGSNCPLKSLEPGFSGIEWTCRRNALWPDSGDSPLGCCVRSSVRSPVRLEKWVTLSGFEDEP